MQDKSEAINKRILAAKAAKDDAALAAARQDWAANRKLIAPALAPFEVVKDRMQFWQETGGLLGRIALAVLAVVVVSRRTLLRIFVIPGLILMPLTFGYLAFQSEPLLRYGLALCTFVTIAQYSYWGNYLPRHFPCICANGWRLRGQCGWTHDRHVRLVTTTAVVAPIMPGATPFPHVAFAAATVGGGVRHCLYYQFLPARTGLCGR